LLRAPRARSGSSSRSKATRTWPKRLYRFGGSGDCRERLVRLLYAKDDKEAAENLLRDMIDDPESDDEHLFATDFYARKFGGRRTGLCTELMRSGRTIVVDDMHRGNPEAGVAGVLRRQGGQVYFAENALWHTLFGLLFWDELFESGQLHSGFDWVPHCLRDRTFHRRFASQIDGKLTPVRSGNAFPIILRTVAAKWASPTESSPGITCRWALCVPCSKALPPMDWRRLFGRCARTWASRRRPLKLLDRRLVRAVTRKIFRRRAVVEIHVAPCLMTAKRTDPLHVAQHQRMHALERRLVDFEGLQQKRQFVGRVQATADKLFQFTGRNLQIGRNAIELAAIELA
jgi:hypothetical protein